MPRLTLCALLLSLAFSSQAQEDDHQQHANLDYAKIDSILEHYESNQEFDKGIKLSIHTSQRSGKQDSLCGEYLEWAAYFYELSNQKQKAIEYYNKTLDVFAKTLGKNSPRYATTLNFYAMFHNSLGDYQKALSLFEQAKNIRKKVLRKNHPDLATSFNNLALLYQKMSNYDRALPLLTKSIKIHEKVLGKEHPSFATSLNNLAVLHRTIGNYEKALPLFIQAKNIKEKVFGKEHPQVAGSLNNLAGLHKSMGNYEIALPLYIQAKNIKEKVFGKEHPSFATSLNNLAGLYYDMENYDRALSLYRQAVNIKEKVLGKEHPLFARSLNNFANVHKKMSNYDSALLLYTQARNIFEKVLGKEHPSFATSLNNLALLHRTMGNHRQAWTLLGQAMNSSSGIVLKHNFDKVWKDSLLHTSYPSNKYLESMIGSLNTAYTWLKQDSSIQNATTKQIVVADLATALLTKLRRQVSNEKDKLRMLAQSNDWLKKSLAVLHPEQDIQKAFQLSDQNKSVLLYQATQSETAYHLGNLPDSLVWQNKKMLNKKSQIQAQLLKASSEKAKSKLRDALNGINQDLDAFEALIKKDYPKYYQLKYQEVATKAQDIQALLDEKIALIEYAIADSVVHIFCVTKAEVAWEKVLVGKEQLSTYIQQLHGSLSNYRGIIGNPEQAYRQYTEPAYWFYEKLLAPVLKDKKQLNKLIIITDGELGHLPFETFLTEKAPAQLTPYKDLPYLLNDYCISYNYSATLWKENKEAAAPQNNGQILGIAADYATSMDSVTLELRSSGAQSLRQQLSPLPAARQEVEKLAATYEGFFAFDSLASERVVKEKAPDFAVLHFATHGLLDERRPILSSLAFTEDNDSTEDNFWQAYEISKMELNAELVVLSACETGYGKFQTGNGIASLARSFMYAGAPSLIVSLWQVSDQATSAIMQQLYQNLAESQAIDEALRQAKLAYIQSAKGVMAHPAFWSPFIQMGKTEPVEIQAKGGFSPWVFAGLGVLVLLLVGGLWLRRRESV